MPDGYLCYASVFLIFIYLTGSRHITNDQMRQYEIETDSNLMLEVENIAEENGKLVLSGWGLRLESRNEDVTILLRETVSGEEKVLETDIFLYDEPGNYYDDTWNFGECGFKAEIKNNKLLEDECYEVLVLLDYLEEKEVDGEILTEEKRIKLSTEQYVFNGELYRYNPKEFWVPEVEDIETKEAIAKGTLLGYDLENEHWFYEWNGRIYFVISSASFGTYEFKPEVPFFIYTAQLDRLSENDREKGRYYKGHYLSEEACMDLENQSYYSGSFELPTEFIITYINTGSYQNRGDKQGWQHRYTLKLDMFAVKEE